MAAQVVEELPTGHARELHVGHQGLEGAHGDEVEGLLGGVDHDDPVAEASGGVGDDGGDDGGVVEEEEVALGGTSGWRLRAWCW